MPLYLSLVMMSEWVLSLCVFVEGVYCSAAQRTHMHASTNRYTSDNTHTHAALVLSLDFHQKKLLVQCNLSCHVARKPLCRYPMAQWGSWVPLRPCTPTRRPALSPALRVTIHGASSFRSWWKTQQGSWMQ